MSRRKNLGTDQLSLWAGTLPTLHRSAPTISIHARLPEAHGEELAKPRRGFEHAKDGESPATTDTLALIAALYRHEDMIRERELTGEANLVYPSAHSEQVEQAFCTWCDPQSSATARIPCPAPQPRRCSAPACIRSNAQRAHTAGVEGVTLQPSHEIRLGAGSAITA